MTPDKQELFIRRVLFLHQVATRRAGKASSARLTLQDWNTEADTMCLLGHVLVDMKSCLDDDGRRVFDDDVMVKVVNRALEGTIHLVIRQFLICN